MLAVCVRPTRLFVLHVFDLEVNIEMGGGGGNAAEHAQTFHVQQKMKSQIVERRPLQTTPNIYELSCTTQDTILYKYGVCMSTYTLFLMAQGML